MQYDTPNAIYNRPAALFVAGFTGAPAMNLRPTRVAEGGVAIGPVTVRLPAEVNQRIAGHSALTLGIRPENLRLLREHDADQPLAAEVVLLEPLGAETLVTLRIGDAEWVARLPASFAAPIGHTITLHANPAHWHVFDTTSGAAL
jgi:multiple sugar transport system ATP-binding protein